MRSLNAVAAAQAGLFTAKQARNAGFSSSSQTYHVQEGNWVREHRGIYRLMSFPAAERPELARWHLWSMDRAGRAQGVYSHHTALCLYAMPEVRSPVLHMTVPTSFRRNSATPEGLLLHYCDLPESDIAAGEGYRLTGPLRTVLDLAAAKTMPRAALSEALFRIVQRGLIPREQVRRAKVSEGSRRILEALLGLKKR